MKAGGLDGPTSPTKFRAEEVWQHRSSDEVLFAHVLDAFRLRDTLVYARLNPNHPENSSHISMVMRQLFKPDMASAHYAVNIPLPPDVADFKIPEELQHSHPCRDDRCMTVNVTPQYTFVDIHIGKLS